MADIGGNITGKIQTKTTSGKNAMGEAENTWNDAFSHIGWLGLQSGEQKRNNFNAKIEESTHVFLLDFDADIYALAEQDTNFMTLCEILQDEFIEGRAEGKVESVLVLLSELGEIPNELKDEIIAQKDTNILDK